MSAALDEYDHVVANLRQLVEENAETVIRDMPTSFLLEPEYMFDMPMARLIMQDPKRPADILSESDTALAVHFYRSDKWEDKPPVLGKSKKMPDYVMNPYSDEATKTVKPVVYYLIDFIESHRAELMLKCKAKDYGPGVLNTRLQRYILAKEEKKGSSEITEVYKKWPGLYEYVVSVCGKYSEEKIALQRSVLKDVADGKLSPKQGYHEAFVRVNPKNSSEFIDALRVRAAIMSNDAPKKPLVNIQR